MSAVAEASGHFRDNVVRGVHDLTEPADGPGQGTTGLFPGGTQGVPLGRCSG